MDNGARTYHDYLHLDELLRAQEPITGSPHEMLFIIQHQATELWFKLLTHETERLMTRLRSDDPEEAMFAASRIGTVHRHMAHQWSVLETLTPPQFLEFREHLRPASGFESSQHRVLEFLFGKRDPNMIDPETMPSQTRQQLHALARRPSLYEDFLLLLHHRGHAIPTCCLPRPRPRSHEHCEELAAVLAVLYTRPDKYPVEHHLSEHLVDIEESFQLWRFRHLSTVRRIIGHTPGTGGTSGIDYLASRLRVSFFPELLSARGYAASHVTK